MSRVADWDSWIGRKVDNGFGELEVLDYEMRFKGRQNFAYFVVKCFCGDIYTTQAGHFKAKRNKSCGCRCKLEKWKYASVEGIQAKMAHGTRLTPINYSHTILKGKNSRCYWNFKCDCGKIVTYWIRDVSEGGGGTLGCGCGKHISPPNTKSPEEWNKLMESINSSIRIKKVSYKGDTLYCTNCHIEYKGFASATFNMNVKNCKNCSQAPMHIKNRKRKELRIFPLSSRSRRNLYRVSKLKQCVYCGKTSGKFHVHHITMRHLLVNRFWHKVSDTYHFETEVINHPRNLTCLCVKCHNRVHLNNRHKIDSTMTRILKAINRFSF